MRRFLVPLACLALALAVPLAPRVVVAVTTESGMERFLGWRDQLVLGARAHPARFLGEWLWVMSPHLALAAIALVRTGRPRSAAPGRRARSAAFFGAAIVACALGCFWCQPVPGMGMRFYLGEFLYPLTAFPTMIVVYGGLGWALGRSARRRELRPQAG